MTREEAIKSALKFLVRKQQEQGSWGYADNDDTHEVSWDEIIRWVDKQPCKDCISRQAVLGLKTIAPIAPVINGEAVHYEEVVFVRDLEQLPPVEPERKLGKWHVEGFEAWCTNCGFHPTTIEAFDYCPSCGAKMEVN